ncbi:hypothetical protein GCM10022380_75010 [Amycolatopsis tucumanensis]|uniref:Uncharacterized protein n=1 Tax=Amycolatopsis tucumanensis TaxID=401106 RepID=A0ABP7JJD6_9PSEU
MRDDLDVTLVNPRPAFVDRVRLHQFVAGAGEATGDYGTLLDDGVHLVVDTATRIDTAARAVRLAASWATTTWSTRSAAPRRRPRCPGRPNSPSRSPNWSPRGGCVTSWRRCHRKRRSRCSAAG